MRPHTIPEHFLPYINGAGLARGGPLCPERSHNTSRKMTKPENPNTLTIDNSAVVLIDHQPLVAFTVKSMDLGLMVNNTAALAQAARDLGVPVVLTTIAARGGVLVDPIFKEISAVLPDVTPIDRTSTNAWSHPDVQKAVQATGRKKLIMAGIATEICLAQSVIGALKDGYEVFFVSDCSGGATPETHHDAKVRMVQAGAKPIDRLAVISEWVPVSTSPDRLKLYDVMQTRGGGVALLSDHVMAQVQAGIVPLPS